MTPTMRCDKIHQQSNNVTIQPLIPELLLPAGDMEKLETAFQYGADAVYAGVPAFSLRARENDFNLDQVKTAVNRTRELGKTIYLTLNIFPHNRKLPMLIKALKAMAALQPDGFIVADPGVIMLCKEHSPNVPLHLSVQANNVNWAEAKFWHQQGISRIILSREIGLSEIKEIHEKNPGLELEFFVHGSICIAYSGRCLMSTYFSSRDGNQGMCSHSCRWKYKVYLEEEQRPGQFIPVEEDEHGTYIMNSKDLCLIEYLKDLKEAGIVSFKVEGRSKTNYYVATVAKAYRKAIEDMEAGKTFDRTLLDEIKKTSNRGFIPGFLTPEHQKQSQDLTRTTTTQTHEFVGIIRQTLKKDRKHFGLMEVKGRLDAPTSVEVMTPKEQFPHKIEYFLNPQNERLLTVHPGQKDLVMVEIPESVTAGTFLRKERTTLTSLN